MKPGDRIAERFVLIRPVGEGGMGAVYLARDESSGAQVALKLLTLVRGNARARFEREARTLAGLKHPNVVGYVAHGVPAEGPPWLAMEWVVGDIPSATQLGLADALAVIRGAARGLAAAHAQGVIHRDIKPSNMILEGGDPERVKLIDFGIARGSDPESEQSVLTATGEAIGTPHYMAPEQARGSRELDARVDVYALGAVLYQLIAGRPPFEGASPIAVLAKILLESPPAITDLVDGLPAEVAGLLAHLLAKDPTQRPRDAAAVLQALTTIEVAPELRLRRDGTRARALGDAEQRLACVVLVGGVAGQEVGEGAAFAPTLASAHGLDAHGSWVDVVASFGGQAELLADGTLVATFSGDVPTDQAQRAARCALALREVTAGRRIAVVAGRTVLSDVLPVGAVLDRGVALLKDQAPRGGGAAVHVDAVVAGLLGPRFEARALGEQCFELHEAHGTQGEVRRVLGVEVPYVGRRRETAAIAELYREVAEEPIARALVVLGGAGAGKTRLVQEALRRIQESAPSARDEQARDRERDEEQALAPQIWHARGDLMRVGAAYGLAADLVRRAAGIREAEPLGIKQMKLAQWLGPLLSGDELKATLFFLGEMLRAPFPDEASDALMAARADATLMADAIKTAVVAWLRAATSQRPVVLCVDDFHHGDSPSRDLLEHALRQLESAPLLVIAVARPELEQTFPGLFTDSQADVLRLTKLTKSASLRLARALSEGVLERGLAPPPEDVVDTIVERADGNAFFLEELLRAAVETPHEALPETVIAMLQARLAALDPGARRVLRAASVFGERFWGGAAGHLLGRADAPDATLEHLAQLEWIAPVAERDIPSEWTWRFRQDVVRDAAYAMLTEGDRRLGHQLAAQWLSEHQFVEPLSLASHHLAAGDQALAAEALAEAAEEALEACDQDSALRHAARGLELREQGAASARLWLASAEALRWRGDYAKSLEHASQALTLLGAQPEEGQDDALRLRALGCGIVAAGQTRQGAALEAHLVALQEHEARSPSAKLLKLIALCRAAHQRLAQRRLRDADALLDQARWIANGIERGSPIVDAWVQTTLAARAHLVGDWLAYVHGTEAAVAAYDRARDLRHACNQRVRLGYGLLEVGEFERATDVLTRAVDEAVELGVPLVEGYALQNLGLALLRLGRLPQARATLRNAVALGERHQHPSVVAGADYYLAEVLLELGELQEAARCAQHAIDTFEGSPFHRSVALAAQARIALAGGDAQRARSLAERAAEKRVPVEYAEGSDAVVDLALALTARACGDEAAARRAAAEGVARLEENLARVPDTLVRVRMRERVPVHAALFALAGG